MNWIKQTLKEIKAQTKKVFKKQEKIDPSASLWQSCINGHINYKDSLVKQDWICDKCQYYFDKPPLATVKTWFLDGGTSKIHNYAVYWGILKHYVSHSYKPNSPREDSIREDYAYT